MGKRELSCIDLDNIINSIQAQQPIRATILIRFMSREDYVQCLRMKAIIVFVLVEARDMLSSNRPMNLILKYDDMIEKKLKFHEDIFDLSLCRECCKSTHAQVEIYRLALLCPQSPVDACRLHATMRTRLLGGSKVGDQLSKCRISDHTPLA